MGLLKFSEEHVVWALGTVWSQRIAPDVPENSCILASRCAQEALTFFNVQNIVAPVGVICYNKVAWDEKALAPSERSVFNWTVASTSRDINVEYKSDTGGFDGHVVVCTPRFLVDLTISQFDRPLKGIVSGGAIVAEVSRNAGLDALVLGLEEGCAFMWGEPENSAFRKSPDWKTNYKKWSGILIRDMKELMRATPSLSANQDSDETQEEQPDFGSGSLRLGDSEQAQDKDQESTDES